MVHVSVRSLQQVPPSPSHLLLDALDLSLQPLDQPVELRDLTPGALQIISMPAGRGLQLTQLCPKGVTCSERLWGLTGPLIQPLQCHKQEKKKKNSLWPVWGHPDGGTRCSVPASGTHLPAQPLLFFDHPLCPRPCVLRHRSSRPWRGRHYYHIL